MHIHPQFPSFYVTMLTNSMDSPPAWRAYVHLYLPVVTSVAFTLIMANPFAHRAVLLASAIPTYLLGSLVYRGKSTQSGLPPVRFTRQSHFYRAAVLFTYGRLFGTRFNLLYFIVDLAANYGISAIIGEQDTGGMLRRSGFLVHSLLTAASTLLCGFVPQSWGLLWTFVYALDRTMYRATYLALVDDLIRVLANPDLSTWRGKALVISLQAIFIAVSVMWIHFVFVFQARESAQAQDKS